MGYRASLPQFEVVENSPLTSQDVAIGPNRLAHKHVLFDIEEQEPEHINFPGMPVIPKVPYLQSQTTKIMDIIENSELMSKATIEYNYDFGDHWTHRISPIGRAMSRGSKIVCISGEGHGPAEDAGG